jgi:hypothetical protein
MWRIVRERATTGAEQVGPIGHYSPPCLQVRLIYSSVAPWAVCLDPFVGSGLPRSRQLYDDSFATMGPRPTGLRMARFLMVIGSLAPLFILWAIRGARVVPDNWWIGLCLLCVIVPNLVLYLRWRVARTNNDHRVILVKTAKDRSEYLLVYLFAMLIPLFGVDLGGWRDIVAVFVAVLFVVFVFWHMNLHYMNILFAAFGYHVFTVEAATSSGAETKPDTMTVIVLSKRSVIPASAQLDTIRLSDTVLVER